MDVLTKPIPNQVRQALAAAGLGAMALTTAPSAFAASIPDAHSTYLPFGDFTTFNWKVLAQDGVTTPSTPTGTSVPLVRLFSNGNTNPTTLAADHDLPGPVKWQGDAVTPYNDVNGTKPEDFNKANDPLFWWGLEYEETKTKGVSTFTVQDLVMASDVLGAIQTLNPGSVTPLFAYDQTQPGSNADIWLRSSVYLVDLTQVSLVGKTNDEVSDALGFAPSGAVTEFKFFDELDLTPPPSLSGQLNPDTMVQLPGLYDPDGPGGYDEVDNNVGGSTPDWGGYISSLDLTQYNNHAFIVTLQASHEEGGQEEAYIIGGVGGATMVPAPAAAGMGLMGLTALCLRRRRMA